MAQVQQRAQATATPQPPHLAPDLASPPISPLFTAGSPVSAPGSQRVSGEHSRVLRVQELLRKTLISRGAPLPPPATPLAVDRDSRDRI